MVGRPNKQGENFNYINVSRLKAHLGLHADRVRDWPQLFFIGLE